MSNFLFNKKLFFFTFDPWILIRAYYVILRNFFELFLLDIYTFNLNISTHFLKIFKNNYKKIHFNKLANEPFFKKYLSIII